jgi:hypothetical protein
MKEAAGPPRARRGVRIPDELDDGAVISAQPDGPVLRCQLREPDRVAVEVAGAIEVRDREADRAHRRAGID